jgi:hypothetical protein
VQGVEAIASPSFCPFYEGLPSASMAPQILAHIAVDICEVGLTEECAVEVVYMLGQQSHADAALPNVV